MLKIVLLEAASKKKATVPTPNVPAPITDAPHVAEASEGRSSLVELEVEETKAYKEKMGQWRRDTLDVFADPLFWHMVDVMSMSHVVPKC